MVDKTKLAFPVQEAYSMSTEQGMTLRDYFAAKALPRVMQDGKSFSEIAKDAYLMADVMMKAREE